MAASVESPNRRARPLSMYAAPGYAPASSSSSAPRSPNISSPSPTTTTTTTRARPNSALGHRTTSSLSSLAQLGLHLPAAAKRGGDELVHAPRTPLQENRAFAFATAADRDSSSRTSSTSPSKAASSNAQYRIQRSNSILMRSPSLAAGQWGAFTAPHSPQTHSPAVGRELNARLEPNGYPPVMDLGTDFSDGTRLIQLVEVLTDSSLGRYNLHPYHRVQKMENAVKALERIKEMGVHLTNIGPEDVVDGNRKLILGMIWSLVLRFSIADINEEGSHAKEGLLLWCQRKTAPYDEVDVKDFARSWQDGLAFCALIHRHRPDLLDYDSLSKSQASAAENLTKAFSVAAEHLGIPQLLDVEDVCATRRPDERSIMTYVAQFFHAFSSRAQAETEVRVINKFVEEMSELMLAVHDYERRLLEGLETGILRIKQTAPTSTTSYSDLVALRTSLRASPERREWMREKVETAQLLGNVRVKLRTYGLRGYEPPEGLRVEDVAARWEDLVLAEAEQARLIDSSITRIREEALSTFSDHVLAVRAILSRAWEEISRQAEPSVPLSIQLDAFTLLSKSRTGSVQQATLAAESAYEACRACEAAHAGLEHELEDLAVEASLLQDAMRKRIHFVENQMVARKAKAVAPEQLEEFETAFRAFDKEGHNRLDLDQLSGALSSLGVSEVNLNDVCQDEEGLVTFEEYMRFMTERLEDRPSGDKVRSCFRSIAGEKGYMTELDLTRLQLPPHALRFLQEHMPPCSAPPECNGQEDPAAAGDVWDYEGFLDQFLE
ncbi:hypothetical protein C6P46_003552 [Rhodotorula mucilaginosa]|uniref:Actin cross-linking n=1 Tax=Rhodotorula mucilaginosa TaxID=5537 RepID=A0A9P6W7Z5_RHOMI|nr:hypothetical protein C6P46_003552 [Rhodotorula mucilaginosa]